MLVIGFERPVNRTRSPQDGPTVSFVNTHGKSLICSDTGRTVETSRQTAGNDTKRNLSGPFAYTKCPPSKALWHALVVASYEFGEIV